MTKRYGRLSDKPPYYAHGASWAADHQLGPLFTASDAQLRDDAWRADSEDHRSDVCDHSSPPKKLFDQKPT